MFARSARIALFLLFLMPTLAFAAKPPEEFAGFVTEVSPAHLFHVGVAEVHWSPGTTRIYQAQNHQRVVEPAEAVVRIGAFVHVDGKFDKKTRKFTAKDVVLLAPLPEDKYEISGVGLIEEMPHLTQDGAGTNRTLWVDGYPLQVTAQTKLLSADGKPFGASKITTNLWAKYNATRERDGMIDARSITFEPNTLKADEVKYRENASPVIMPPDYAKGEAGTIKFHGTWMLKILPDKVVQDYVTGVGESLIPEYQKELSTSDPAKIDFRFYVVEQPSGWKEALWKESLDDTKASAGGVVIVPDHVLAVLDNEAQLAALLSNCIEMTLEKQLYQHRGRLKAESYVGIASDVADALSLYALPVGIGYSIAASRLALKINEKASRIGLRDMLREGYDIREAPFAWTVAANQDANNPNEYLFHPPALVESVMKDLYFEYQSVDYSNLETRRDEYLKMLRHLRKVVHKLPKSKNYPDNAKN
jgi:hypothetical protein